MIPAQTSSPDPKESKPRASGDDPALSSALDSDEG